MEQRSGAERGGDLGEPIMHRCGVVVDDVIKACTTLDRQRGCLRGGGVTARLKSFGSCIKRNLGIHS